MTVTVYGKRGCGLCEAAASKLELMKVPYKKAELHNYLAYHEGWREDDSIELRALYCMAEQMPLLVIDGKAHTYSQAMKELKRGAANERG